MRDVTHSYDGKHLVLNNLSFQLNADGSSVAIVAPSGSGKTTFLSIIGGLLRPSDGEVGVADRDRIDPVLPHVSWVFQTTNTLSRRSAIDNVAVGALARGAGRKTAISEARRLLATVGLEEKSKSAAATLSGGETQRLSVARALASGTDFLLADEPTGQLDRDSSDRVVEALFHAVNQESRGLVVVTHDPAVAQRCDKVLQLTDGKLVE